VRIEVAMARGQFAAYLNGNAKKMSPDVVSLVEELIYPDDIFYCNSFEEGAAAAKTIIERGYPTVFTGGGDGTAVNLINDMWAAAGGERSAIPTVGLLSFGTGNAMAGMVSSGSPLKDLKSYVANPSMDTVTIGMVESEGHLFPFGGLGVDAQILSDYISVKQGLGSGVLKPIFQTVGGYFFAFFGLTAPRHISNVLTGRNTVVRITNLGRSSWKVVGDGAPGQEYKPGELLYEGTFTMLMTGTCPYYGYGMKVMPFADLRSDAFQLRLVQMSPGRIVANLGPVWKGTYRDPELHDFYCSEVRVELSSPSPYQRGGDLVGDSTELVFRHVPNVVRLLRFI